MTYSEIYNAVCDQVDDTSDNMKTRVKRYINWTKQDIASRRSWEFILKKTYFQCTDDYSTGTVAVTNGSTTVTGTDTAWTSSMVGRKFRCGNDEEYYTISAVGSTTSLTLDQSYIGTTDTEATYLIYQDEYSLASDCEKVLDITNPSHNYKLAYISRQEFDARVPDPISTGTPEFWIPAGRDSNNYMKVQLYLIPDDAYVIYYWYRKKLPDSSTDDNVPEIPPKYHKLLYLGALAQAYEYLKDGLANNSWAQYENMIQDMINDLEPGSEDSVSVMRSIDEGKDFESKLRLPPSHFSNE